MKTQRKRGARFRRGNKTSAELIARIMELPPMTQGELAAELGVTRGRIWQLLRPSDHAARARLHEAVSDGTVIRPNNCSRCGIECIPHGHHTDYSKPLDVVWLCPRCHRREHSKMREGKKLSYKVPVKYRIDGIHYAPAQEMIS